MSLSAEDYIRTIFVLSEDSDDKAVRQIDIAKKLNLNKASVSEMVKKLMLQGYVNSERYSKLSLTKKGFIFGKEIIRKHRIMEVFLVEVLGLDKDKAHIEAHKIEHCISAEIIERLYIILGRPVKSPTEKIIPR